MRVNTAIHEIMGISVLDPQELPSGRVQEIHATDIHGNRYTFAMFLSNGCEGLPATSVVGFRFDDVAQCDKPLPTSEGLHS